MANRQLNGHVGPDFPREASETTPLLAAAEVVPVATSNKDDAISKPSQSEVPDSEDGKVFQFAQVFLLCFARFCEPLSFFCIFPYIFQMIRDTGVDEVDVGFWSGLTESLFSLSQMLLMIPWGRAADVVGRKPVLLFSLAGMALSMSAFGMSTALWQILLFRCLAGMFGGMVVTTRTMIAENSTPSTQAKAFSWYGFAGNVGIMLGPAIGGILAEPAKQISPIFGGVKFWEDHPYALPGFFTSGLLLIVLVLSALFIKETLPKETSGKSTKKTRSTLSLVRAEGVGVVLWFSGFIAIIAIGYTAILPIFLSTSVSLGGCGLGPRENSIFMMLGGLSQAFYMLVVFPILHRRFGTIGILYLTAIIWPLGYVLLPFGNVILSQDTHAAVLTFWIAAPITLVMFSSVAMSFIAIQLAVNDIAPEHESVGMLNALALTLGSGIRSFAPALFSSLAALGFKHGILKGYFIWLILFVMTLVYGITLGWLPGLPIRAHGKAKTKGRGSSQEVESGNQVVNGANEVNGAASTGRSDGGVNGST